MFEEFWNKRRKKNQDEPKYISLCYILEGSGAEKEEIEMIFNEYIPKEDFLPNEKKQMVAYLVEIAQDKND